MAFSIDLHASSPLKHSRTTVRVCDNTRICHVTCAHKMERDDGRRLADSELVDSDEVDCICGRRHESFQRVRTTDVLHQKPSAA